MSVDDNSLVTGALERRLSQHPGLEWRGGLARASDLPGAVRAQHPDLVLVDMDMPGEDPLPIVRTLCVEYPEVRFVAYSGVHGAAIVERAITSGVRGYLSKADSLKDFFDAIDRVMEGEFVLSPVVRRELALATEN